MSYLEDLKENAKLGADLMKKYLKGEIQGSDKVKYASLAISHYGRHEATKGNIDAIKFAVGRSITKDGKELKDYIEKIMPEYMETKKLKQ